MLIYNSSLNCATPSSSRTSHLRLSNSVCFPFSLVGKVKQWFYKDKEVVNTWSKCFATFLAKFFPVGKTNALRGRIANFQQTHMKLILKAWERLHEYIQACPHHGMENWLVL
jgi:hypothetical protein